MNFCKQTAVNGLNKESDNDSVEHMTAIAESLSLYRDAGTLYRGITRT